MSATRVEQACDIYGYMMELVDTGSKIALHRQENCLQMTPLDLAADMCLPEILLCFFRTDDVYRFVQKDAGLYKYVLYDVTRYEDNESKAIHLLNRILNVNESELERYATSRLLSTEPFPTWSKSITQSSVKWFYLLYVIMTGVLFYHNTQYFFSDQSAPTWFSIILLAVCTRHVLYEIWSFCKWIETWRISFKRSIKGKRPLVLRSIQRLNSLSFFLLCAMLNIVDLTGFTCRVKMFYFVCTVFASINLIEIYMFFFQLQTQLSHYVIILQEISIDAIVFSSFCLVRIFAFTVVFYLSYIPLPCTTDMSLNHTMLNNQTHVDIWGNFSYAFYKVLILGYGVVAPPDLFFSTATLPHLLLTFYIILLLAITLILFNLFIAIFSDHTSKLNVHKDIINKLQQMSISMYVKLIMNHKLDRNVLKSIARRISLKLYIYLYKNKFIVKERISKRLYLLVIEHDT